MDMNKVKELYILAAKSENKNFQCNLAIIYEYEIRVNIDIKKAIYFYILFAKQEVESFIKRLKILKIF
jgi:TPR repeat protein